ncbi:hypothetical protein [Alkalilimnicola ehrlichii]|nr:hypothetical protein [Alkalilimnicola ehrlichii]
MHCGDLSDAEVRSLRAKIEEQHEAHTNLGRLFITLAAILAVVMALALL